MNFQWTEEQEMIRKEARKFAVEKILPHRERLRKKEFPEDIRQELNAHGYAAPNLPEEYGGGGLGTLENVIITEEFCRIDGGFGLSVGASASLVGKPIELYGTKEQKETWLPRICTGEILAAYGQTTPNAGSDMAAIETTGVFDGDYIVINGTKRFITNGDNAKLILVLLCTESSPSPYKNMSFVLVDADKAKAEGTLTVPKAWDKTGLHCSPTNDLIFENCRVHASNILGQKRGDGFKMANVNLTLSRSTISAQALGLGRAGLECTMKYVTERKLFGKFLGEHQITQSKIARMATTLDCARLLTYRAAWLIDETMKNEGISGIQNIMGEASMAKLYAAEAAEQIALMSAKLHGGYGYMEEYPIKGVRDDALVLSTYEGVTEVQEFIIARQLLAKYGLKI